MYSNQFALVEWGTCEVNPWQQSLLKPPLCDLINYFPHVWFVHISYFILVKAKARLFSGISISVLRVLQDIKT